ncbi:choline transporter-like protein 2 [Aplysia californica]|uniref:Choline transporter-like protein n=1 Tax=Aplysia californica TaxID=6500 RepID=A0ABM1A767_APLCA|nr:choline transporter-like protein 2 [Aplysia californica]
MPCCGGSDENAVSSIEDDSNQKNYGEPKKFDPNFKGPMANRSCTDIICCFIFLVCVTGLVCCSIVGYARGDPIKLVYPTDSFGNICGEGDYEDKKYLLFFDLLKCAAMGAAVVTQGCPTPQICVSSCPTTYWSYVETVAKEVGAGNTILSSERSKMICKYTVDPQSSAKTVQQYIDDEDCAAYYVKTTAVINRCIPSIFLDITNWAADITYQDGATTYTITDADNSPVTGNELSDASYYMALFYEVKEFVELIYKDVLASWWMLFAGFGIAMFVCMVWIVLMRWLAGPMVWITIGLVFALLLFATYYSYDEYYTLKQLNATEEYGLSQAFALNFSYYLSLKKTWLAFGCTLATVTLILLLLFVFLVKRICIAIELIKEASRAIGNMFSTLFWPIIPFFLQIIFFVYWAASAIFVASMGDSEFYSNTTNTTTNNINYYLNRLPCTPDNSTVGSLCDFVKYGGDEYIIPMQLFMLFMMLWVINFIVALGQMTLAGAFGSYYWAWEKPKDVPAFPLAGAVYRSLRFHLGSLAFGAFIIAVVQFIRIMLEYIEYKLKDSENRVAKIILKILKCCFWCLEKFLKFLNKNAYIMIAIRGKNFCFSAKDAFMLIMRNIVRVVVLDKVTDFLIFLSKALVTGIVFVLSFFWFKGSVTYFDEYVSRPELNYYLTPVIILTLATYLLASAFFSVYSMAVDTLFLCFLEDLEMNDGSVQKPYFMSKGLMKVLGKKNDKMVDPKNSEPNGAKGKKASAKVTPDKKGRPLPEPEGKGKKGKWS